MENKKISENIRTINAVIRKQGWSLKGNGDGTVTLIPAEKDNYKGYTINPKLPKNDYGIRWL